MIILRQKEYARKDYAGLTEANANLLRESRNDKARRLREYRNDTNRDIEYERGKIERVKRNNPEIKPEHFPNTPPENLEIIKKVRKDHINEVTSEANNRIGKINSIRDKVVSHLNRDSDKFRTELLNKQLAEQESQNNTILKLLKEKNNLASENKNLQDTVASHQNEISKGQRSLDQVSNQLKGEQAAHNETKNVLKNTQESLSNSNAAKETAEKNAAKLGKSLKKWKIGAKVAAGTGLAAGGYALYEHNKRKKNK